MSGDEGFLTLATGMRVSPKPMEKILIQIGRSLTFSATAQMADANTNRCGEPVNFLKGSFPFREGRRPENLLKEYAKFS